MNKDLPKTYAPRDFEDNLYSFWLEKGYFHPTVDKNKTPYTIVIPPPNVTGKLHMGHALDDTLQDIIIRMKRMQGYAALWLPGMDHAGIATQIKVEEALRKQGLTRYDIGREAFIQKVWEWKENFGGEIINQLKKMGFSCDWERQRFTMDEGLSTAVKEAFVRLYEKGLIYRGARIINYCPSCKTALSDEEVEYEEQDGRLWHIRYQIENSDEFITVATTRPETLLGDTGIAVNPNDERYKSLVGKNAIVPLCGRVVPIFADDYVDAEFGTGCVKITPAHDPNDFVVGQRHNLPQILILDNDAKINENGGKYKGLDAAEARKQVIADLEAQGLLVRVEEHKHNVGTCHRCGSTIEPIVSTQWFVKMKPLAEPALDIVAKGDVKFVPQRFTNLYKSWMENVHDWCISRQLWWGHRIPAFYCGDCGHTTVSREDVHKCEECGSQNIKQEDDVLDTWFSSALWPFATLGWPEKTPDFEYFYPTDTLVTAYDIIFFWVSRMIFSAVEYVGERPFKNVFMHGLVRDAKGRKMSKSLGNGIDPLEMIDRYGTDALRFTLATGINAGSDIRFSEEKIEASRNFANKIWNAARFINMNLTLDENDTALPQNLTLADKWILSKFNSLVKEVTDNIDKFEIGVASAKIYSFIWDDFCDWYIEIAKMYLQSEDKTVSENAQRVLCYVFSGAMKLLHPFMPFITETVWQSLPHNGESIMISEWPKYDKNLCFADEQRRTEIVMSCIKGIRNRRAELSVRPTVKTDAYIVSKNSVDFEDNREMFMKLAFVSNMNIIESVPKDADKMITVVGDDGTQIFLPLAELVDTGEEIKRLEKEIEKTQEDIKRSENMLANKGFVDKAPQKVVDAERQRLSENAEKLKKLKENLAKLKK